MRGSGSVNGAGRGHRGTSSPTSVGIAGAGTSGTTTDEETVGPPSPRLSVCVAQGARTTPTEASEVVVCVCH